MTLQQKYKALYQRSGLPPTIWGQLFNYGSAAYTYTWSKLKGKEKISFRDAAVMNLVEYLLDRNLLYNFILEKIELTPHSKTKLINKFFEHFLIDCTCGESIHVYREKGSDQVPVLTCPLCERKFKAWEPNQVF